MQKGNCLHVVMDNIILVSDDDEDEAKDVVNGDSKNEIEDKANFMIVNSERPSKSEVEETALVNSIEENKNSLSFNC